MQPVRLGVITLHSKNMNICESFPKPHKDAFAVLLLVFLNAIPIHAAPPPPPRSPAAGAAASKPATPMPFIFNRTPYPGGELFKAPTVPIQWTVSVQKAQQPSSSRSKSPDRSLAKMQIYMDKMKTVEIWEFAHGLKQEFWTFKGMRLVSAPDSPHVSFAEMAAANPDSSMLWSTDQITYWPGMEEIRWIKPDNFVSRYQGQESSYLIFAEEENLEDPGETGQAPAPSANAKPYQGAAPTTPSQPSRAAQAAAQQQYPPGLIPGVPLKSNIRAALIDETTRLPKRVQFGLETLIYTYETKPENLAIPKKIAELLPPELATPEKPKAP